MGTSRCVMHIMWPKNYSPERKVVFYSGQIKPSLEDPGAKSSQDVFMASMQ